MRRVEFEAADRAWHASRDRYRLSPREAYVLRSAPIRGLSPASVGVVMPPLAASGRYGWCTTRT
jgi:hypothetical protein